MSIWSGTYNPVTSPYANTVFVEVDCHDVEVMSSPDDPGVFFDSYFSPCRFGIETFLAALAVTLNASALVLLCRTKHMSQGKSVYRVQFANLTVVNVFACACSWIFNNALYLFHKAIVYQLISSPSGLCKALVFMVAGSYVSSAFGILNTMSILGFATTHYFAICRPLENMDLVRRSRVVMFVLAAWAFSVVCGSLPFGISYIFIDKDNCTEVLAEKITNIAIFGCNVSISLMTIMYVITIFLCIKIYMEVRFLQCRLSQFRFIQNVQGERKVFVTTVILLSTLSLFFLPYTFIYILTLNMTDSQIMQRGGIIYYMNFLPYFKFLSDPLVYGARMRDMQFGVRRLLRSCCRTKCASCAPESSGPYTASSTRSSIRIPLRNMRSVSLTTV